MNISSNETGELLYQISDTSRAAIGITLLFIFLIGGAGNTVMSLLVFRHTEMHSIINLLLSTMAASDAIISIACVPFDIVTVILRKWIFGCVFCFIHAYVLTLLVVQNVVLLVIISIDRYLILVHKRHYLYDCKATSLVSCCLLFSMLISCPPIFGFGKFLFMNAPCKQGLNAERSDVIYLSMFSSLVFVLPFGLLLLAYVQIISAIRKSKYRVRPELQRVEQNRQFAVGRQSFDARFKQKTFSTILYLYIATMSCKIPLLVSLLIQKFSKTVICPTPYWVLVILYSNSAINPFIYASKITTYWMVLNGKFRHVRNKARGLSINKKRNNPECIYKISIDAQSSSLAQMEKM
ncbi:probable G-protein coupled receptor 45 [Parasteatoda tepidariorum]|uniref:probable G-protein coupled receptor 45 n=1 Tax=Parasteatoda tepidariorum TaxID=114398 RepID=UPI00077F8A48|nr:probable G-protein coupled receptor 45 [Parasteatoda tepidariorum]